MVNGFNAEQQSYRAITGVDPGLNILVTLEGKIGLSNEFVKITSEDKMIEQLAKNGAYQLGQQIERGKSLEEAGTGVEWTDKGVALI